MEEAAARRGATGPAAGTGSGTYEQALRVIGRWMDGQKPRDVFLFEQEGAYVIRLLTGGQQGVHHQLAEFTRDDVAELIAQGPLHRAEHAGAGPAPQAHP
jgi:hypothetical protein